MVRTGNAFERLPRTQQLSHNPEIKKICEVDDLSGLLYIVLLYYNMRHYGQILIFARND